MRNDGSEAKTRRMTQIGKKIAQSLPNPVDQDKILLWIRVNIGLSPKKAEEYLNDVVESHDWILKDGMILASESGPNG